MFYAPNVKDADIGGKPLSVHPFVLPQGPGLYDVIVVLVGQNERAKVVADSTDLLSELCSYRKFLHLRESRKGRSGHVQFSQDSACHRSYRPTRRSRHPPYASEVLGVAGVNA